jgi:hypothetical protein
MGFSLYNLFKAGLLSTNAVAILHPKRFLSKFGYDRLNPASEAAFQNQIVAFLQACAFLKLPLIIINILVIVLEIIAG